MNVWVWAVACGAPGAGSLPSLVASLCLPRAEARCDRRAAVFSRATSLTATVACRSSSTPTRWWDARGECAPRPLPPALCWCWRCWDAPRWRAWPSPAAIPRGAPLLAPLPRPRLHCLVLPARLGMRLSRRRHAPIFRPRRPLRLAGCTPRSSIWRSQSRCLHVALSPPPSWLLRVVSVCRPGALVGRARWTCARRRCIAPDGGTCRRWRRRRRLRRRRRQRRRHLQRSQPRQSPRLLRSRQKRQRAEWIWLGRQTKRRMSSGTSWASILKIQRTAATSLLMVIRMAAGVIAAGRPRNSRVVRAWLMPDVARDACVQGRALPSLPATCSSPPLPLPCSSSSSLSLPLVCLFLRVAVASCPVSAGSVGKVSVALQGAHGVCSLGT